MIVQITTSFHLWKLDVYLKANRYLTQDIRLQGVRSNGTLVNFFLILDFLPPKLSRIFYVKIPIMKLPHYI